MVATSTIILSVLAGNDPIALSPLQVLLAPHSDLIVLAWMAIWCTTVVVVLYQLYRAYRSARD